MHVYIGYYSISFMFGWFWRSCQKRHIIISSWKRIFTLIWLSLDYIVYGTVILISVWIVNLKNRPQLTIERHTAITCIQRKLSGELTISDMKPSRTRDIRTYCRVKPQGLSPFRVRLGYHIWYHTPRTQNRLSPCG